MVITPTNIFQANAAEKKPKITKIDTSKTTVIPIYSLKKANEGWYKIVFKPKVKNVIVPIEIKENGGMGIKSLEENAYSSSNVVTVGIYKDKACKKLIIEDMTSLRGLAGSGIKVSKGKYYVKFHMDRIFDSSKTLEFDCQMMLSSGKNKTLKQDVSSYTYLNDNKITVKFAITKPSKVILHVIPYDHVGGGGSFQLLDSSKKALNDKFNTETYSSDGLYINYYLTEGTYYVQITDSDFGATAISYKTNEIDRMSSLNKESAIKIAGDAIISETILLTEQPQQEYWYLLDLSRNPKFTIKSSGRGSFQFDIINQNGENVKTDEFDMNSKSRPSYGRIDQGTYYIKVTKLDTCYGTFTIQRR